MTTKKDNRLCNLHLMTQQQNCKKSAKNRDYNFAKYNHQNKKCVKAVNCETKETRYFKSMYAVNQHLGINAGMVKRFARNFIFTKPVFLKKMEIHTLSSISKRGFTLN